jgi:hypothetical protein
MKNYLIFIILFLLVIQSKLVMAECSTGWLNGVCCDGIILGCFDYASVCCSGGFPFLITDPICSFCDTTPPAVTIQSPGNSTYTASSVWANVILDETGSWCGLSFDGRPNTTMTNSSGNWNNLTTNIAQGSHNIRFYCNDTAGNMNGSSSNIVYFSIDSIAPTYSNDVDNSSGSIKTGGIVSVHVRWSDTSNLGTARLYHNHSSSMSLISTCSLSGTTAWCNKTIDTTGWSGLNCWKQTANDIYGNLNSFMSNTAHCFNVLDSPPTYSFNSDNSGGAVNEGQEVNASTFWNDDIDLSYAYIVHDETGSWVVNSSVMSGTSSWYNYTIKTDGHGGRTICWYQNATDTTGNANNTMKDKSHCFNVLSTSQLTAGSFVEALFESVIKSIRISSSETSVKFVTLLLQFFGMVILFIILVVLIESIIKAK